jgi:hypothetical protein
VKRYGFISILVLLMLVGCESMPFAQPTSTPTLEPPTHTPTSPPPTNTPTSTVTHTPTSTLMPSDTPTPSDTPIPADTETPTITPTEEPPTITANGSVNCRYGPDKVYLYAWGLSEGDTAQLDGRNYAGTWLWVQPHDTNWHCWVAASAVTATVDVKEVKVVYPTLLVNPEVPSPTNVHASRSGDSVTITWDISLKPKFARVLISTRPFSAQPALPLLLSTRPVARAVHRASFEYSTNWAIPHRSRYLGHRAWMRSWGQLGG